MSIAAIETEQLSALCRGLKLPTIARLASQQAEEAARQGRSHMAYLI